MSIKAGCVVRRFMPYGTKPKPRNIENKKFLFLEIHIFKILNVIIQYIN